MPKRRNPVVRYGEILRKGGVHTSNSSNNRRRLKRQLEDEMGDWEEDRQESINSNPDKKGWQRSPRDLKMYRS